MTHSAAVDDRELLELLLAEAHVERRSGEELYRGRVTEPPLSAAQRQVWFIQQTAPDSPAYNVFCAVRLCGRLNLDALQRALNEIVRRQESLRTCFPAVEGRPTVCVSGDSALDIPIDDLAAMDARVQREQVSRLCAEEARGRFDLSTGPLLRVRLLRLKDREHVALLTLHHIVADGWSMGVLLNELSQLYEAFDRGRASPLSEPTVQYGDFADWQERWLKGDAAAEQRRWWKERLAGLTPLDFPTDRPRPAEPSYRGAGYVFRLPARAVLALKELGQREGATLFMTLLAVFSVLLHRYTGQKDIVVGAPVANRNRREFEPLIGFFVNSLIMRCDVSGKPSFLAVLRRVRDFALDAMAHQDLPFEELVKELAPERDPSSNPVFQIMFSLENWPVSVLRLPELTLTPVDVETHVAKFDLLLNIGAAAGDLVAAFEYATDLFDADTVARMAGHFTTLLEAIAANPQADVATLPLLTAAELAQLAAWNDTAVPYPREASLATLFERQVQRTPDTIAIDFPDARLSYAELNARANRLARRLRGCGVGAQTPVAIHTERSAAMVVGLLGVLKAGGCYVPLDPAYPTQRLELMLADCHAVVLLTQRSLLGRLPAPECRVLCLDADLDGVDDADPDWPPVAGGDLAYIIYTSGSTGEPKGVAVPQRAVSRLVLGSDYIALQPDDVVAQASNASFDAATFEIWGALLNGAQLVGVERELTLAPAEFAAFLHEREITTLWLTAGLFNQHVDSGIDLIGGLRQLLIGGERLSPPHVNRVREQYPRLVLINGYGPTENTTFSTCHRIERNYTTDIPIGRPIANSTAHVLDANRELLPVGVPGELYVGGDGLAHGYLGRPELTAERFVPNPFDGGRTRLYRTGDIVRRLPGGELVFVGRRDDQVKIRGFRVEPGEIETTLVRHPAVLEAVVLAREDQPGRRELVAYVVAAPECGLDARALRNDLARQLPGHMVPAHFVVLPALPLNENGKVDRRALPAPADVAERDEGKTLPSDMREQCLADVWRDVLGGRAVGIHDNYFELGGDSITAIQVVSRVRRAGWRMRVADLFRHPTVAALAPCLELVDDNTPAAAQSTADVPLTAVQRWFFAQYREHLDHFNQSVLLEFSAALDERHLRHALDALARRHDALRLRFHIGDGAVRQRCAAPGEPVTLDIVDLRGGDASPPACEQRADAVQRALNLAHGPLFRAAWFRLDDSERLLLVIHHLAVDGVSWRILLEDLELGYRQIAAGEAIDLGAPTCSFHRWAEEMHAFATSPALAGEAPYWARIDAGGTVRLPTQAAAAALRHGDAQTLHFSLPPEDTGALLARAHRAFRTEIMDLLLTALGRALKAWSGSSVTWITLEGHGREPPDDLLDLSRTVGWFTSLYPFVLDVPGDDIGAQIARVKTALREVPRNGVGYGLLRYREGVPPPDAAAAPQLSFNYLGQFADGGSASLFRFCDGPSGRTVDPRLARAHELDIVGLVASGRLLLSLEFDPGVLTRDQAAALLAGFGRELAAVARYCCDRLDPPRAGAGAAGADPAPVGVAGEVENTYPLSPLQEGFLFQSLLDPDAAAYLVQVRFAFTGPLDTDAFRGAWLDLCRRHAVLRTAFVHDDSPRPMQVVLKDRWPAIRFDDLRRVDAAQRRTRIDAYCLDERRRGFDLQREPLMRIAAFREGENDWHIVWTYHHILLDGWCLAILQRDFLDLYAARLAGRPPRLPGAPPYRNYIRWLGAQDRDAARRYWRGYLEGYEQPATLPKLFGRDVRPARALAEHTLMLDAGRSARLAGFAAGAGVTLNAVVQSLWGLLLSRYNDRDDVVFGTIVSGRPAELPGVEQMVGLFISAVPLRVVLPPDSSFGAVARAVQEGVLASGPHQHLSLADIQLESVPGRGLFDHMLIFENYPLRTDSDPAESGTQPQLIAVDAYDPTHYELDLTVAPGERIAFKFTFDTRVYRPEQIERTAQHLLAAVDSILRDPAQRVRDIEILPRAERDLVLRGFNSTTVAYPRDRTLVDLFEEQAARVPDATALRCGEVQLSYDELERAANRLARHLQGLGVGPEAAVGVCVERTPHMIVAPLAIMKAGGMFVPLDPGYPRQRLEFMLEDARIGVLLTQRKLADRLPDRGARVVLLDADAPVISMQSDAPPPTRTAAEQTAYAVYTSGSTGRPKGVAVAHRSLANMAFAWRAAYGLEDFPVRLLQMASMSFDVFLGDLVRALSNGGALVVCPADAQTDPASIHDLLIEHSISIFESTPGVVLPLMEHIHERGLPLGALRVVIVGSDVLPAHHFRTLWQRFGTRLRLLNSYGAAEATIDSSCFELPDAVALDGVANTPIGRPLANTRFYVLDRHGRPQPLGAPGELHIGGAGVARGYLNRAELTAARFVPCTAAGGERVYRTGDLARWLSDGNMEFLGRIDFQVKVRGFRIELGEVEDRLLRCPSVEQAVVVARDFGQGNELVAYVVAGTEWDVGRAREFLREALPDYMVPGFFVRLDRMPLSPNGKIDRRALPDPHTAAERTTAFAAPGTATERAIAAIWHEVLQVERIGVLDDFFELGGHSLKAMQITAQIHKAFGVAVALRRFFDDPTVAALARLVDGSERSEWQRIPTAPPQEHYVLSHAQRRLWMLHHMDGAAAYNMPEAHVIHADIDAGVLGRAFETVIRRHEALRTAFVLVDGEPRQVIRAELPFALAEFDLCDVPAPLARAREIADADAIRPFDLSEPPLLRATLARLPGGRSLFVLTLHHIIGDGWSGNLIFRELLTLYDAYRHGRSDPLPQLRIQYKDFAHWQNAQSFAEQERYWLAQLSSMPERIALPYDFAPGAVRDFSGDHASLRLEAAVVAGLRRLALSRRTTLSNVMLALFELLLFHWTRQGELCVGMSVANRSHPDVERLIGFFVNVLPIRCRLDADMEFDELLSLIIEGTHEALEHQDYPFDLMIEKLNPTRRANRQPLVNVIYAFQNFADVHVEVASSMAAPEDGTASRDAAADWEGFDFSFRTSKFDLTLFVAEEPDALDLTLEYDSTLFLAETIRGQLRALADYAAMVCGAPADQIGTDG